MNTPFFTHALSVLYTCIHALTYCCCTGSPPQVRDEAGVPVSRVHLLQLEKRLLCKCLVYALLLQQHVDPQIVASMLEVLVGLSTRLKAAGAQMCACVCG